MRTHRPSPKKPGGRGGVAHVVVVVVVEEVNA
jgi:hypothetical protein